MVCARRIEFLSKFSPVPSPHVPSYTAALVERLARRVLAFFVRHAALLRPLSQAGKLQLAKVPIALKRSDNPPDRLMPRNYLIRDGFWLPPHSIANMLEMAGTDAWLTLLRDFQVHLQLSPDAAP